MKKTTIVAAALAMAVAAAPISTHASRVGAPAPDFKGTDSKGKVHNLSDFKGKWVVLEWHNEGCPYVKKHYGGGNMQKLQQEWTAKGVVWLTVLSSASGQQGHMDPAGANAYFAAQKAAQTAVLHDPSGEIGRLYDAKTTPHMFVIGPDGSLVYNGAIDDKPSTDQADLHAASNYVSAALSEGMAGKPVAVDLGGASEFVLQVEETPDGISCDQADWAEAKVSLKDGQELWLADLPLREGERGPESTALPFSFTYDGKPSSELLRGWGLRLILLRRRGALSGPEGPHG